MVSASAGLLIGAILEDACDDGAALDFLVRTMAFISDIQIQIVQV